MRIIALFLSAVLAVHAVEDFEGKVVSIADGDTVTVLRGREQVKVRLNGIDAPEKNQSFGTKSKDALAGLVFGKTVTVQSQGTDRYGRTLGVLVIGGTNVNERMVADGWAWHYKQYTRTERSAIWKCRQKARNAVFGQMQTLCHRGNSALGSEAAAHPRSRHQPEPLQPPALASIG